MPGFWEDDVVTEDAAGKPKITPEPGFWENDSSPIPDPAKPSPATDAGFWENDATPMETAPETTKPEPLPPLQMTFGDGNTPASVSGVLPTGSAGQDRFGSELRSAPDEKALAMNPTVERARYLGNLKADHPIRAAAKEISMEVAPTAAALAAASQAGGAMAKFGGIPAFIGGFAAALLAGGATRKAQDLALQSILGDDKAEEVNAQLQVNREAYPIGMLAAQQAPQAMFLKPMGLERIRAAFDTAGKLGTAEGAKLLQTDAGRAAMGDTINLALGSGTGAAMETWNQIQTGQADGARLALTAILGAVLSDPTKAGEGIGMKPAAARGAQVEEGDPASVALRGEQQQVARRDSAMEAELAYRADQQAKGAGIASQGTPARAAATQEGLAQRIKDGQLDGELQGLLGELKDAQQRAQDGGTGRTPIKDDRGGIIGWTNQGAAYPEGMNADTITALEKLAAGKKLTDRQVDSVERAVDLAEARVARDMPEGYVPESVSARPETASETVSKGEEPAFWGDDAMPIETASGKLHDLGNGEGLRRTEDGGIELVNDAGSTMRVDANDARYGVLDEELRAIEGAAMPRADEAEIRTAAEAAAEKMPGAKGRIIGDESEVPPDIQGRLVAAAGEDGITRGFMVLGTDGKPTGEYYILAKNIGSAAEAEAVVAHEAAGHIGVRGVLGDRLDTVLDGVFKGRSLQAELRRTSDRYKLDLLTPEGHREAAEEVIAQIAERRGEEPGPWKRFVAGFRETLRAMGFEKWMEWTENDVLALVNRARNRVSKPLAAVTSEAATGLRRAMTYASGRWEDAARTRKAFDDGRRRVYEANREGKTIYETQVKRGGKWDTVLYSDNLKEASEAAYDRPQISREDRAKFILDYSRDALWYARAVRAGLSSIEIFSTHPEIIKLIEAGAETTPRDHVALRAQTEAVGKPTKTIVGRQYPGQTVPLDLAADVAAPDIRRSSTLSPTERRRQAIEAAKAIRAEQGLKMRGTAERVAARPAMTTAGIEERAGSYRTPLTIRDRQDQHANMTDAELQMGFTNEDNPWRGLDVAELYNRTEAAYSEAKRTGNIVVEEAQKRRLGDLVDQIGKKGTDAALFLRFIQEIKGSRPEFVVDALDRMWVKAGVRMTDQQRSKLTNLARESIRTAQAQSDAEKAMKDAPTDATIATYKTAKTENDAAQRILGREVSALTPKKWTDMIRSLRQGNLLRTTSHETNVASNFIMGGIDWAGQNVAALANKLANVTTAGAVEQRVSLISPVERIRGMARGLREGLTVLREGTAQGSPSKVDEINTASFAPIRAWGQAFTRAAAPDLLLDSRTGRVRFSDRAKKLVEATAGAYAEINFRMLQAEDLPGRSSRYDATLRELGRKKGLTGPALEAFTLVPDREAMAIALSEADVATYQQKGVVTAAIENWRRMARENPVFDWVDAMVIHGMMPYVKTPVNVMMTGLKIQNPALAMASGTMHAGIARKLGKDAAAEAERGNTAKADALRGKQMLHARKAWTDGVGLAVVGATMNAAAAILVRGGAIRPAPNKDEKRRAMEYALGMPGSMNTTALRRYVASGFRDLATLEPQEGDTWRKLAAFGFFGVSVMAAATGERRKIEQGPIFGEGVLDKASREAAQSVLDVGNAVVEQTFLMGLQQTFRALDREDLDQWLQGYAKSVVGGLVPGLATQTANMQQEYIPEMRAKGLGQAFRNAADLQNPFVDWERAYPYKRDPLGYPVSRTPQGVPKFWYHMLDYSKSQPVGAAPGEWEEAGKVYAASQNTRALPSVPGRSIQDQVRGKTVTVKLEPEEYEDLLIQVGEARRKTFAEATRGSGYQHLNPDQKADVLDRVWSIGLQIGKRKFLDAKTERAKALVKRLQDEAARQGNRQSIPTNIEAILTGR